MASNLLSCTNFSGFRIIVVLDSKYELGSISFSYDLENISEDCCYFFSCLVKFVSFGDFFVSILILSIYFLFIFIVNTDLLENKGSRGFINIAGAQCLR